MRIFFHLLAGGSLGLLVGFLTGLAVSPVVASLLGVLAAAAAAFLGLKTATPTDPGAAMLARIGGFAIFCIGGIFWGLNLRTHGAFTPSLKDQLRPWTAAGFSAEEARAIVRFKETGLLPPSSTVAAKLAPDSKETVLFALEGSEACPRLAPSQYRDLDEWLKALQNEQGDWKKKADLVEKYVPPEERMPVLKFLWRLKCQP